MKSVVLLSCIFSFSLPSFAQIVSGRPDMGQGEKYDIAQTEVLKRITGKKDYVGKRWWWYAIVTPAFPFIALAYEDGEFYGTANEMSKADREEESLRLQKSCQKFLKNNIDDGVNEMVDSLVGMLDKQLYFYTCSNTKISVVYHEDGVQKKFIHYVEVLKHTLKLH